jgi:hypothetical protein
MASLRYVDKFLKMRCAPDVLARRWFPNAKEVSESMGVIEATSKYLVRRNREDVIAVVVGDGKHPRTAGLAAFTTAWMCVAIDPVAKHQGVFAGVDRLYSIRAKAEDVDVRWSSPTVVIAPHSHCPSLRGVLRKWELPRLIGVVTMDCCVPHDLGSSNVCYEDPAVISPKRRVEVHRLTEWYRQQ